MRDPPEPFRRIVRELAVDSEFPRKGFWILNRRRGDCKAHAKDRQSSPVPCELIIQAEQQETRRFIISNGFRCRATMPFPAQFMLVAAMNPTGCGAS
ncbi:MAG: ATP-binding protein [Verrucomicrobia bacterium]|nr:ATP-binding protein [Verrucomicrobiota bacterium]